VRKQINSNLNPVLLLCVAIDNGKKVVTVEDISKYQVLVIQEMSGNATYATITIFKNRFLEHRVHYLEASGLGKLCFNFKTNTSVEITGEQNGVWAIITGIKLC